MKEIEIIDVNTGQILIEFKSQVELINIIFSLLEGRRKYFCLPDGKKLTIRKKYENQIPGRFRRTMPPKRKQLITGVINNSLLSDKCLKYIEEDENK